MELLILHVSDIHFKSEEDSVLKKEKNIKNAIQQLATNIRLCFIVVSGDIGFSGSSNEYTIALDFLINLKELIKSINDQITVEYVIVPGNHDCDFERNTQLRDVTIKGIIDSKGNLTDNSIINQCTLVQDNFFNLLSCFTNKNDYKGVNRIYYDQDFDFEQYNIRFKCYNSAWMSQKKEKQGDIYFPLNIIKENKTRCDLIFSVFHHPYNWLEADNGRGFKKHIEKTSDIIITGHEHDSAQYVQNKSTGETNEYLEGGVLQEHKSDNSDFNVLIVDLQKKRQKIFQYYWNGEIYSLKKENDWEPFYRNRLLTKQEFENKESFKI